MPKDSTHPTPESRRSKLRGINPQQFNLSHPVASVIISCEQIAPLEQNVQAALNFTPISESGKQRLQEKVAPSRAAWQKFLRTHEDSAQV